MVNAQTWQKHYSVPLKMLSAHPHPTSPAPSPPVPLDEPVRRPTKRLRQRALAILAAIGGALAKLKTLVLLLPKLKLLATAATAVVSIGAYSLLFGWVFAAGFVALLFIHEMGHVLQLRREGIKASAPMFIPFLGAVISAQVVRHQRAGRGPRRTRRTGARHIGRRGSRPGCADRSLS